MYLFSKTMLVLCPLLPASLLRAQLVNPLIPIPVEMVIGKGAFTISPETAIKYTGTPVAIPAGASDVKVVTYRNGKQMGRVLSINIKELH